MLGACHPHGDRASSAPVFLFVQNLLEKPGEREVVQDHALSMVQCKVLKQLQLLEGRKFDDPDITDDIEFLNETLQTSVQDLRYYRSRHPNIAHVTPGGFLLKIGAVWLFALWICCIAVKRAVFE